MGFFDRFRNKAVTVTKYEMITDNGNGFYAWNGNIYQSDIVRSAIRPKARAIGKAVAKHIRKGMEGIQVNPDPYMRFLLEEPNPYMTGQMMQEKLATHLELNHNAFAYINRDANGYPTEIYPVIAAAAVALKNDSGELFLRFTLLNGKTVTFRYTDIIHLRKDFNENEIFGDSPAASLTPLMEIINTTDQGIVKAIKNSNVIRWLLKFNQTIRPEDMKKEIKGFVDSFLNVNGDSDDMAGAAGIDNKFDAQQVDPKDYVPNERQMNNTVNRIYAFFNTNEKIVHGNYSENDWIAYYESAVESDITQMSGEYTRKLFTRKERGFGNKIAFESSNLSYASMQTKLELVQLVDRGAMSPNELREVFHYAPVEGGDEFIRRLDTRPTTE